MEVSRSAANGFRMILPPRAATTPLARCRLRPACWQDRRAPAHRTTALCAISIKGKQVITRSGPVPREARTQGWPGPWSRRRRIAAGCGRARSGRSQRISICVVSIRRRGHPIPASRVTNSCRHAVRQQGGLTCPQPSSHQVDLRVAPNSGPATANSEPPHTNSFLAQQIRNPRQAIPASRQTIP